MFTQLLASRPAKERSAVGLVTSVVLHGSIVVAALYLTVGTERLVSSAQATVPVYVPDPPPAAPVPPVPPVHAPPVGGPVVAVPIAIPATLPPLPADPVGAPTLPGPDPRFVPGGATTPTAPPMDPNSAYLADQVEVEVALTRGAPPRYPSTLRAAGVEGDVRFRFVVDTTGRVEIASVEQLGATHGAFAIAVRETLAKLRFSPARVGDRRVRQLVEYPVVFRIRR